MTNPEEEYGPAEAFDDFKQYVEEENLGTVPFENDADGEQYFLNLEKQAINAKTHYQSEIGRISRTNELVDPLRDKDALTEDEEVLLQEVDETVEEYFQDYSEVEDEFYDENGRTDTENILQKSTPVEDVNGVLTPELELFIDDIFDRADSAEDAANRLEEQYDKVAEEAFSREAEEKTDERTYERDQNKGLKEEEIESHIESIESIRQDIERDTERLRSNTREMEKRG